jgi:hypothetical protein
MYLLFVAMAIVCWVIPADLVILADDVPASMQALGANLVGWMWLVSGWVVAVLHPSRKSD